MVGLPFRMLNCMWHAACSPACGVSSPSAGVGVSKAIGTSDRSYETPVPPQPPVEAVSSPRADGLKHRQPRRFIDDSCTLPRDDREWWRACARFWVHCKIRADKSARAARGAATVLSGLLLKRVIATHQDVREPGAGDA